MIAWVENSSRWAHSLNAFDLFKALLCGKTAINLPRWNPLWVASKKNSRGGAAFMQHSYRLNVPEASAIQTRWRTSYLSISLRLTCHDSATLLGSENDSNLWVTNNVMCVSLNCTLMARFNSCSINHCRCTSVVNSLSDANTNVAFNIFVYLAWRFLLANTKASNEFTL